MDATTDRFAARVIGQHVDDLDTPAVLVDLDVLEHNVRRMAAFAHGRGVALRPHTKSHKTVGIAERQRAAGSRGLTVAKLDEAAAYLSAGFDDIFVANEVVGVDKWQRLAAMQRQGTVAIGVDNAAAASGLNDVAHTAGVQIPVLIEVDSGLARAGVQPGTEALVLAQHLVGLGSVLFRGLFTHAGHAYGAHSPEEVARIGRAEGEVVVETAVLLRAHGVTCEVVSVGSTPTAFHSGAVAGVTEIRPGNYVFYDRMQVPLGSARAEDCSLSVLARVISRPSPERAVLDAGSKTFALDRGAHGLEAVAGFGQDLRYGLVIQRLSEEHGVLNVDGQPLSVGDRLRIVPNHACTVTNLAEVLVGVRGDVVVEALPVMVRGGGR